MFCPNCGTKLPDGAAFCSNCGNKIQAAPVEPVTEIPTQQPAEPVYEQPAPEQPAPEQPAEPVYERPVYEQPVYEQPAEPVYEQPVPEQPAQVVPDQAPADYMTINIILCVASVLTCCGCVSVASLITSIIGIVAGSACKKAVAAGDWATAEAKSKTAKTMWIVSAVLVGLSIIAAIILFATGSIASMTNGNW